MTLSYFKRYTRFSIGGELRPIEKTQAKALITRFNGRIKKEYRLPGESRQIVLSNNNIISLYID